MRIGVIDYDAGNLKSVETALQHLGVDFLISDKPEELSQVDKIIFPGVGEAKSAMENLRSRGMDEFITNSHKIGKPILGICIGSQILLDSSDERQTKCLGLIPGKAIKFQKKEGFKVPQIGWNSVKWDKDHELFYGIPQNSSFFFVHSYYTKPTNPQNILAESIYSEPFVCGLIKDNLVATQFHPEKSGPLGLRLLKNFIERVS
ncbi:imidazole glycerol phosphate synthase subunit HisH [Spirochaeta cellobiosiphila]|uniref:imidazole glycerol phosphate synthase subunit HisH n=1 Tax=Spirochaeta cellobiosiphila TaxID=504483 RepID=UPI00041CFB6C|nr:imidazole glycerol phosphate synthase subunit HisH [Spirochaeta cellobiosiphila]